MCIRIPEIVTCQAGAAVYSPALEGTFLWDRCLLEHYLKTEIELN